MIRETYMAGLICASIATGYLSSAPYGFLLLGCGMMALAFFMWVKKVGDE
jgi:hypothetical protein